MGGWIAGVKVVREIHLGDLTLDGSAAVIGTVTGSLFVTAGRVLVRGEVHGNLILDAGHCRVDGRIHGDVENRGGTTDIFGVVDGAVLGPSATTIVHVGAVATLTSAALAPRVSMVVDPAVDPVVEPRVDRTVSTGTPDWSEPERVGPNAETRRASRRDAVVATLLAIASMVILMAAAGVLALQM